MHNGARAILKAEVNVTATVPWYHHKLSSSSYHRNEYRLGFDRDNRDNKLGGDDDDL